MMSISSSIKFLKTPIIFHPFPKIATFLKPPFPLLVTPSFKPISFQSLSPSPSFASSPSSSPFYSSPSLPPSLEEIINLFQSAPDPRAKFQQLLHYAAKLPPLDEKYKTKENKVEGCVSQVWVRAYLDENEGNKVYYEADSDSVMTKGLAALLVFGLSGQGIEDVVRVSPDFVTLLGLQQTLSPSRNNGFVNMLRLMKVKAVKLGVEAEKETGFSRGELGFGGFGESVVDGEKSSGLDSGKDDGVSENVVNLGKSSGLDSGRDDNMSENVVNGEKSSSFGLGSDDNGEDSVDGVNENVVNGEKSSSFGSGGDGNGGRKERIREVLEKELKPVELEVEDVSYQHAGHAGVRGSDGGTHFNLKVVSEEFQGKSLVKRHRIIYGLLQDELQSGLHALSITAKTPSEVAQSR